MSRFKCEYCGKDFLASAEAYNTWQTDHIIPQSKGESYKRDQENLASSCKLFNFIKKDWVPPGGENASRENKIMAIRDYIFKKRAVKEKEVTEMRLLLDDFLWDEKTGEK